MRKFFVCMGLAAAGSAGLQAAYTPDLNPMETAKVWSMSGTLRGFYDDNYNTQPSGPAKRNSFGFEVSPSFSLNVPLQQTELGLRYIYGLYYYQDRETLGLNPIDQTHQFDFWVDHAFNERFQAKVQDSVVVAQDPQLLNGGTYQRTEGNNLHNLGSITLDSQWTRLVSTELTYQNNYYDYQQSGGNVFNPSLAGQLNRIENLVSQTINWLVMPTMTAYVGYAFEDISYIGNESIGVAKLVPPTPYNSQNKNNVSHYVFVGANYTPLDNLNLGAKAGIQYIDYYNPPPGLPTTDTLSPYAQISATYTYLPGSYVQFGFNQTRSASSVVNQNPALPGTIALDQETSAIYGTLNHQFSPRVTGNLVGTIDYSTINGGGYNGQSETFYSLGLNVAYTFNQHVSAEVGYNYDDLSSNIPGQWYNRNRVYLGVTGTY
jgi:hypothetical protein